jgi:hypothetical protein
MPSTIEHDVERLIVRHDTAYYRAADMAAEYLTTPLLKGVAH